MNVLQNLRGTESILIVDDESLVRNVCTAVLTNAGYRVFSAEGGDLALQMINAMPRPVHLALIDVRMPRMNGPDLIVALLDSLDPPHQDLRFILMSGYSDTDSGTSRIGDTSSIRFCKSRLLPRCYSKRFEESSTTLIASRIDTI